MARKKSKDEQLKKILILALIVLCGFLVAGSIDISP